MAKPATASTKIEIVTPAPLIDFLRLYTDNGVALRLHMKAAVVQHAKGETIGVIEDGEMIAAVVLYPVEVREDRAVYELAFHCRPAIAGHLVALIHLARSTRARLADTGPIVVRAHVRSGHRPGQRLARLCGLVHVATEIKNRREVYEWDAADGQIRQGSAVAVRR